MINQLKKAFTCVLHCTRRKAQHNNTQIHMYPIAHIRQKSSRSHFKHFEEFFPPRSHQEKWAVPACPGALDTFCADDYLVRYICFKIYSVYFGTCSRRTRRSRHRVFIYPSHANIRPCVPACAWVALWPYPQILKYTYTRPILVSVRGIITTVYMVILAPNRSTSAGHKNIYRYFADLFCCECNDLMGQF